MRKRMQKKWLANFLVATMAVQPFGTTVPWKVSAASSDIIFHDFEGDSLDSNASGRLTKEEFYQGNQALEYIRKDADDKWNVEITAKDGSVDISEQNYITFWIKDSKENNLEIKLIDKNGKESKQYTSMKSIPGEWTLISFPLSSLNLEL